MDSKLLFVFISLSIALTTFGCISNDNLDDNSDEYGSCIDMQVNDIVELTIRTIGGEAFPVGDYQLDFSTGTEEVVVTWSVDEDGHRSEVSDNYNTPGDINVTPYEPVMKDLVHIQFDFPCPREQLSTIDSQLYLEGILVDQVSISPSYNNDQPSEPNGEGCGFCWSTDDMVRLIVPSDF